MKIAIVVNVNRNMSLQETHAWAPGIVATNEAELLTSMEQEVRVYCTKNSSINAEMVSFDMLPLPDIFQDLNPAQKNIRELYYKNLFHSKVINHLKSNPVDVIHLHDYRFFPLYETADLGIPVVVTIHGDFQTNFENMPEFIWSDLNKMNVISITSVNDLPMGIKPPIAVIPNIINVNKFSLIKYPSKNRFVYVGRVTENKGVDIAIEAASGANVALDIYGSIEGDDEWISKINKLISENENIKYWGKVDHDKIASCYDAAGSLLTMREPEGFTSTVLESVLSGTPVVTFGLGGAGDIVNDGVNGFKVKSGDKDGLIHAIKNVSQIDREKCRQDALDRFEPQNIGRKLISVFEQVISNN